MSAIVYISDGNNIDMLNMSMNTVKKASNGSDISFYVLSTGPDIRTAIHATIVRPTDLLYECGMDISNWRRRAPHASLIRLALPLLSEFNSYGRVLFMDTDVLVRDELKSCPFSSFLYSIGRMDMRDCEIAMPPDQGFLQGHNAELIDDDIRSNFPDIADAISYRIWEPRGTRFNVYGNAGVSVWNLDRIRYNGLSWYRRRLSYLWRILKAGKFDLVDQDFSNTMMEAGILLSGICGWVSGDVDARCVAQHFAGDYKKNMRTVYDMVMSRT